MKILDSTTIIGIFDCIDCPNLFNKLLELNHDLCVPSAVIAELENDKDSSIVETLKDFTYQNKIQVLELNSEEELKLIQKTYYMSWRSRFYIIM